MGLGLFIAKTLLERSGAELTFANAAIDAKLQQSTSDLIDSQLKGAIVDVRWQRNDIERNANIIREPLGPNQHIDTIS
jgi:two-component system sensor histidine kinase RegB